MRTRLLKAFGVNYLGDRVRYRLRIYAVHISNDAYKIVEIQKRERIFKSWKKDTNLFILLFQTRIDAFFIVHNVLDQNCIELFFSC